MSGMNVHERVYKEKYMTVRSYLKIHCMSHKAFTTSALNCLYHFASNSPLSHPLALCLIHHCMRQLLIDDEYVRWMNFQCDKLNLVESSLAHVILQFICSEFMHIGIGCVCDMCIYIMYCMVYGAEGIGFILNDNLIRFT